MRQKILLGKKKLLKIIGYDDVDLASLYENLIFEQTYITPMKLFSFVSITKFDFIYVNRLT